MIYHPIKRKLKEVMVQRDQRESIYEEENKLFLSFYDEELVNGIPKDHVLILVTVAMENFNV